MAPVPDDAEILSGCLRGDKRSWDAFVERYSRLVYWAIWRALKSRRTHSKDELCRDVFQEFFRRALEGPLMERFAAAGNLQKYIQVTAVHLVFERLRHDEVRERSAVPLEDVDAQCLAHGRHPAAEASGAELRRVLGELFGELKGREAACLELHYLEGRTHREIGEILGISQDTASTILRRAKERLRQLAEEKGLAG